MLPLFVGHAQDALHAAALGVAEGIVERLGSGRLKGISRSFSWSKDSEGKLWTSRNDRDVAIGQSIREILQDLVDSGEVSWQTRGRALDMVPAGRLQVDHGDRFSMRLGRDILEAPDKGTMSGHATSFMCTYHGWTYDLKGALVGVPGFKEVYHEELDRENWGLIKARTETYGGFIFACMDEAAPGLDEYLEALEPEEAVEPEPARQGGLARPARGTERRACSLPAPLCARCCCQAPAAPAPFGSGEAEVGLNSLSALGRRIMSGGSCPGFSIRKRAVRRPGAGRSLPGQSEPRTAPQD